MIELYTHATPNGHKVSILLEELGLPYELRLVDLLKSEQMTPAFLAINPNNKIPAIVDHQGPDGRPLVLWESGAILIYLAEKVRSDLLPVEPHARYTTLQWLMFQMAGVGPMFGQAGHFTLYAKAQVPYGIERYSNEAKRILGVLDKRLGETQYLAGDGYTIADIATYPWTNSAERIPTLGTFDPWPNVARWRRVISARPAVHRGLNAPRRD
ncbi:MAG TPA: glutathione S-transferase N-terminal domain-containing protein [Steroidobacteraceae bacterium]|nr:glutathione S-transferase N-terminal domain-containing protein [Steroidobacteraceae bacterium]HRX88791.1 glutathione S-transferase N-terminal domain-containing protein [Steroidobacteraceae bacterium]